MDVLTTVRRLESALHTVPAGDEARSLTVTAEYRLSPAGRKAAFVNGANCRSLQRVTLAVPVTRLHLVHVERDGTARLKLVPRYALNADRRIVRIDARPSYDHPPTADDLLHDAARNHELERAYFAQLTTAQTTRHESNRQWLDEEARAFLSDHARRAVPHPPPTLQRCQIMTRRGALHFDATHDHGVARQVPLEAFRRYQNDLRIRDGHAAIQRERDIAAHAEKETMMREWVMNHGSRALLERTLGPRRVGSQLLEVERRSWRDPKDSLVLPPRS